MTDSILKLSYPVFLNSNFQLQDQAGRIIADLFRFGTTPECSELGEWMAGMINQRIRAESVPLTAAQVIEQIREDFAPIPEPQVEAVLESPTLAALEEISTPCPMPVKRKGGNPLFQKGMPNPYAKKKVPAVA